ncbi:DUF397 domain-containing protein [Saccharothrix yanglingensis]|uniref:DUF397 domain-containing protein n=1 Tax=Saccharothrix yanglingensis TaxID=659496 RepID=A0ABU0WXV6_9PSEU|nr:DUF397 domain-containing protein [Saccharothrix yanglingensis]MDQ2584622.1 DUF397 domain-containing protein [Saccharothrix yanglingensis]
MSEPRWFKSSHSANNGSCVEVAFAGAGVLARDSKNPAAGHLRFPRTAWARLLRTTG